jgi:hypothetical protein
MDKPEDTNVGRMPPEQAHESRLKLAKQPLTPVAETSASPNVVKVAQWEKKKETGKPPRVEGNRRSIGLLIIVVVCLGIAAAGYRYYGNWIVQWIAR